MLVLTSKLNAVRQQDSEVLDAAVSAKACLLEQKLQSKLIKLVIYDIASDPSERAPIQRRQDEKS